MWITHSLWLIWLDIQFIIVETKVTVGNWQSIMKKCISIMIKKTRHLDCHGVMTPSSGPPIRTNSSTVMKFDLWSKKWIISNISYWLCHQHVVPGCLPLLRGYRKSEHFSYSDWWRGSANKTLHQLCGAVIKINSHHSSSRRTKHTGPLQRNRICKYYRPPRNTSIS